jgi:diguanylate cyclase (GGDEF)-like protein/PAS domain S-box-containing protein
MDPDAVETIALRLRTADAAKLRAIARADGLALEDWACDALLSYAQAEWEDPELLADFKRLLDEHPDVLDELARRDGSRASAFVVLGVLVGVLSRQRARIVTDTRWFEMSNDMLVEASLDGYFTRLSDRWEQCLGWTREELMSRPFRDFIHPDDLAATAAVAGSLDERPGEVVNFENRYRAKDGSWRWLLWSARSDEHRKYAVARDITDRKRLEQEREELFARVEAMARTDPTTGLANRRSWEDEIRQAIARTQRDGHPLAVAMVDLDRFKMFNDAHGHPAGDALLTDAATSWRLTLRVTDFLARYGGEEFALLLPDCPPGEALGLLDRFRAATPQDQTVSIGIAYWDGSESSASLVARADAALYEAKHAGRDRVVTSQ